MPSAFLAKDRGAKRCEEVLKSVGKYENVERKEP